MIVQPLVINQCYYKSVENFYQACKTNNALEHVIIASTDPHHAKQLGKKISLSPTWEQDKLKFMEIGLRHKFSFPHWKQQLLDTNDEMIVEWNNWGDVFWGVSEKTCKGHNHLGNLLMTLRSELQNNINLLDCYDPNTINFDQFNTDHHFAI